MPNPKTKEGFPLWRGAGVTLSSGEFGVTLADVDSAGYVEAGLDSGRHANESVVMLASELTLDLTHRPTALELSARVVEIAEANDVPMRIMPSGGVDEWVDGPGAVEHVGEDLIALYVRMVDEFGGQR